MVNLCNAGTKDFVELWEIIHLKVWTNFSIRQTKFFWINFKHYSQTCSNEHPCKTTTRLRRPILSLSKQIPTQSLLYKTTTCLMRPAMTLLSPKWRKACLKQSIKTISSEEMRNKHKEQCIKKYTSLWLRLFYCYFIMQSLFNVYKSWTIYKIMSKNVK